MAFDFPNSPSLNQEFTPVAGTTYVWNGQGWVLNPASIKGFTIVPRTFTASGTYTPTAGLVFAEVECVGGGGAGGGATCTANSFAGAGGGSGAYSRRLLTAAQIGASQTVTIGVGGTGASNANGNAGTDTSFGALCIAKAGGGGSACNTTTFGAAGAGGAGASGIGDITASGAPGEGVAVANVTGLEIAGGAGGSSIFGGGGAGAITATSNGAAATNYGSGGGGAIAVSTGSAAGGNGSPGVCIVTEYIGNQPLVGGNVTAVGAPTAGQVARWTGATAIEGVAQDALISVPQCGRLAVQTSSSLQFKPFNGDLIKINGAIYKIPSGGIAGLGNTGVFVNGTAGQNLAADTTYLVCAFDNGGTITGDYRTTITHLQSTTPGNIGTEIPTGLDTRTVIGLIRTITSSAMVSDATRKLCISWFNRANIAAEGAATGNVTTSSTSLVELNTNSRVLLVTWGDEAVNFGITGYARNNTNASDITAGPGIDGTAYFTLIGYGSIAAAWVPMGGSTSIFLAEGFHTISPFGSVSAGTGLFQVRNSVMIRG